MNHEESMELFNRIGFNIIKVDDKDLINTYDKILKMGGGDWKNILFRGSSKFENNETKTFVSYINKVIEDLEEADLYNDEAFQVFNIISDNVGNDLIRIDYKEYLYIKLIVKIIELYGEFKEYYDTYIPGEEYIYDPEKISFEDYMKHVNVEYVIKHDALFEDFVEGHNTNNIYDEAEEYCALIRNFESLTKDLTQLIDNILYEKKHSLFQVLDFVDNLRQINHMDISDSVVNLEAVHPYSIKNVELAEKESDILDLKKEFIEKILKNVSDSSKYISYNSATLSRDRSSGNVTPELSGLTEARQKNGDYHILEANSKATFYDSRTAYVFKSLKENDVLKKFDAFKDLNIKIHDVRGNVKVKFDLPVKPGYKPLMKELSDMTILDLLGDTEQIVSVFGNNSDSVYQFSKMSARYYMDGSNMANPFLIIVGDMLKENIVDKYYKPEFIPELEDEDNNITEDDLVLFIMTLVGLKYMKVFNTESTESDTIDMLSQIIVNGMDAKITQEFKTAIRENHVSIDSRLI